MVWIDVETTGLEPAYDQMLELAIVVTDGDLEILGQYEVVLQTPALMPMVDHVREMHERTGLLELVKNGNGSPIWDIAPKISSLFLETGVTKLSPLCGSSVHFDRSFFLRDFPMFKGLVHYRNVDVSTIKELIARWAPEHVWRKADAHRAMPDVLDSIAELAHYRKIMRLG